MVKSGTNIMDLFRDMNSELQKIQNWCLANKLSLNSKKTKFILFKPKNLHVHIPKLYFGGSEIERIGKECKTQAFKFLGHWVDDNLTWDIHTTKLISKLNTANYAISQVKTKFPFKAKKTIYNSLVQSILMWGSIVTGATSQNNINKIQSVQNKIVRNLCSLKYNSHTEPYYYENNILKFTDIICYCQTLFAHKFRKGSLPATFNRLIKFSYESGDRQNRDSVFNFHLPPIRVNNCNRFPLTEAIRARNKLNVCHKFTTDTLLFKDDIKYFLLDKYKNFVCTKHKCFSCERIKKSFKTNKKVLVVFFCT